MFVFSTLSQRPSPVGIGSADSVFTRSHCDSHGPLSPAHPTFRAVQANLVNLKIFGDPDEVFQVGKRRYDDPTGAVSPVHVVWTIHGSRRRHESFWKCLLLSFNFPLHVPESGPEYLATGDCTLLTPALTFNFSALSDTIANFQAHKPFDQRFEFHSLQYQRYKSFPTPFSRTVRVHLILQSSHFPRAFSHIRTFLNQSNSGPTAFTAG